MTYNRVAEMRANEVEARSVLIVCVVTPHAVLRANVPKPISHALMVETYTGLPKTMMLR